ncbi:MAG: DNA alkylation response protein [Alphaproteobacteria bacterium]|nr:MAG: DNA alkylation response protein [Alphaproteobacteria bacterium]
MPAIRPVDHLPTHDVINQPEPRGDVDLWAEDAVLRAAMADAGADTAPLAELGALLGREETRELGRTANRCLPELVLFDRAGRRLDEVRFHPAYHRLMEIGIGAGYAALPWEGAPGGHAAHAAMLYMFTQVEPGVCCPMTMTYAAVPALEASPEVAREWRPRLLSRRYDGRSLPAAQKAGATMGMAMTEKQGGSDVRANTTRAEPDGDGLGWRLTGHKWFCSAPMSDAFLTLAQAPGGLTCFLVPRWTPEGERNAIRLMRLKDKLGNRANASAEIEYDRAWALRVGEEGRGVRTIIEMVQHTRLDTGIAPAGLMRAALAEARWWVEGRSAFQRRLIDQPLMRRVLADLVLDWEAVTRLAFRMARALDRAADDAHDRALARVGIALAKFHGNKLCPGVIYEAMEVLGGMGFVEETPMPLLFRESPLNSIWEGSGNVICLDVFRALAREPETREALAAELDAARGADRRYDAALDEARALWPGLPEEGDGRIFTERMAELLAASVLIREAPGPVADGYVATRLGGGRGRAYGTARGLDEAALIARI